MEYATKQALRLWLPDKRLVTARVHPSGLITFAYRTGHIHPALVRDIGALSAGIIETGLFELSPGGEDSPRLSAWLEAVPEDEIPFGELMEAHTGKAYRGLPPYIEIAVRADLIDLSLVREMNEVVLPGVCRLLVPRVEVGTP